jgi:hypothetical protein
MYNVFVIDNQLIKINFWNLYHLNIETKVNIVYLSIYFARIKS